MRREVNRGPVHINDSYCCFRTFIIKNCFHIYIMFILLWLNDWEVHKQSRSLKIVSWEADSRNLIRRWSGFHGVRCSVLTIVANRVPSARREMVMCSRWCGFNWDSYNIYFRSLEVVLKHQHSCIWHSCILASFTYPTELFQLTPAFSFHICPQVLQEPGPVAYRGCEDADLCDAVIRHYVYFCFSFYLHRTWPVCQLSFISDYVDLSYFFYLYRWCSDCVVVYIRYVDMKLKIRFNWMFYLIKSILNRYKRARYD